MDEIIKLVTPQNFAMLISIYLIWRVERTVQRNTNAILILAERARDEKTGNGKCDQAIKEITCGVD